MCQPTLQHVRFIAQVRQFIFLCNIYYHKHTDFGKLQSNFHAVQGKAGLRLLEELYWKSEKIYLISY